MSGIIRRFRLINIVQDRCSFSVVGTTGRRLSRSFSTLSTNASVASIGRLTPHAAPAQGFHTTLKTWQEEPRMQDNAEEREFQAETRMLLDIVANSLYSEKEVFIRELIANASDAIEKTRYLALQGVEIESSEATMKIHITTDKYNKTLTVQDSGIGMTKEELINNLGTIARSGSKAFLEELKQGSLTDPDNIIGKFGVGFYSAFMVAERVEVLTLSRRKGSTGYRWVSDGSGKYFIEEYDVSEPGTKVVCHLKLDDRKFADEDCVKDVIKKYSSFVGSPVEVNSVQVNNVKPLWTTDPREVTSDEHDEFYRYISSAYDKPRFTLHFHTDAPLNLRCLLYFPEARPGLFSLNADAESGVSLYSRRVLIQNKADSLLPKWLRFVKGVVDSEDIPLNLSRELLQKSAILNRLSTVINNRVVRFLVDKARKDADSYNQFFTDYGLFIKEGIVTTQEQVNKEEIAKLLIYESSATKSNEKTNLATYIGRMPPEQKDIFYLAAPSRELAESSPYFESMKKRGTEVLFCYEPYDEVVLLHLQKFGDKNLISVEKEMRQDKGSAEFGADGGLEKSEASSLMDWWKGVLTGKCWGIKATPRLVNHPCVVTVEEMGSARHFVRTQFAQIPEEQRYSLLQPRLEINPNHPLVLKLNALRATNPHLAELLAKQLFNNAMVIAGLVDNASGVLLSMNELLELAFEKI